MKKIMIASLLSIFMSGAIAAPSELNICTGGVGGFYEDLGTAIGRTFGKASGVTVNILNTGGSVENSAKMKEGECHMAIIQADAVTSHCQLT